MTGPAGKWHGARERRLRICREESWGCCPEEPSWSVVPVFGDGYKLKAANPHFRPATQFGGWKRSVHISHLQIVTGRFVTLPWPQVTGLLLEMALDREAGALPSYCMDYCTPADPRRHLGVMVDDLDVIASAAGRDVEFRFALQAAAEEANAGLTENDFDYSGISPVPFMFDRAALKLDGTPVTGVEQFTLRVKNSLAEGPNRGGTVAFLLAGQRAVSLEMRKLDDGDAFNAAVRTGGVIGFEATLLHPEGYCLCLELPVLHPEGGEEDAEPGRLARASLRMEAGTDGEGNDISYTLDLGA
ncbi:MAG: hypothetical protein KAX44_09160 [Candidatus Brocadiae bacterium]|nr:hypothetical protein [Candidatus Brocadiia bacterium]